MFIKKWPEKLFSPVDASSLALFRFLFGLVILYQFTVVFSPSFVQENILSPSLHFPYPLFEWLDLDQIPKEAVHIIFRVTLIAIFALTVGVMTRIACITALLGFSYVFMLDKSWYNNHYYLMILLLGVLCISHSHRWLSLALWRSDKESKDFVPFWQIFLLRFHILIAYFYGAIIKLTPDWLVHAQPMRRVLREFNVSIVSASWDAYFCAYTGLLFDLLLPVMLIWGKYKRFTFACILLFNLANHFLFGQQIAVFPFLMIASYVLFLEPSQPRHAYHKFKIAIQNCMANLQGRKPTKAHPKTLDIVLPEYTASRMKNMGMVLIVSWICFQLIFPLHWRVKTGTNHWIEEGRRFSWTMMSRGIDAFVAFSILNPKTNKAYRVRFSDYLSMKQYLNITSSPDMMKRFTKYLYEHGNKHGIKNPVIRFYSEMSLNGRAPQPFYYGEYSRVTKEFKFGPLDTSYNYENDYLKALKNRRDALMSYYIPQG